MGRQKDKKRAELERPSTISRDILRGLKIGRQVLIPANHRRYLRQRRQTALLRFAQNHLQLEISRLWAATPGNNQNINRTLEKATVTQAAQEEYNCLEKKHSRKWSGVAWEYAAASSTQQQMPLSLLFADWWGRLAPDIDPKNAVGVVLPTQRR